MDDNCTNEEIEKALKNFLLDIDCLNNVSPWINKFNLFHVLKIDSLEIRHSNMLAWLLDANENHGLGDKVLLGVIKFIIANLRKSSLSTYDLCQLLHNSYSFSVFREYNNIDFLLVSHENKVVICIENKVYSSEHDNQLERYKNFVEKRYSGYKQFYLYLTLYGEKSSIPDVWASISYATIQEIIETACKNSELSAEVEIFIHNYLEIIKEKIRMNETEIKKVCNEIYLKHKKALDLIYANKSSETELIYLNFKDWIAEHTYTGVDENSLWVQGDYIRFKTSYLTTLFPKVLQAESGWKTDSFYYYELWRNNNSYTFWISFAYTACSAENKQKIDAFLEKMGQQQAPNSWGKFYHFEKKEYDRDTFLKGDFTELIKNIKAEEEKMKSILDNN